MSDQQYKKVKEQAFSTYAAARKAAESLFSPYGTPNNKGGMTCEKAKVRIRYKRQRNEVSEHFCVVLYQRLEGQVNSGQTGKNESETTSSSREKRAKSKRKEKKSTRR